MWQTSILLKVRLTRCHTSKVPLLLGKIIGDLGGVNISLKAYALSLGAQNDSDEELTRALDSAPCY